MNLTVGLFTLTLLKNSVLFGKYFIETLQWKHKFYFPLCVLGIFKKDNYMESRMNSNVQFPNWLIIDSP